MTNERYKFRDALKENTGLAVYNTGYEKCDSGHSWGPAVRDHYLIHFVSSGKGVLHCNKQEYAVDPGSLFLISPSQLASYQADTNDPWCYSWVGFNGTDARRLVNQTGFTAQAPVLVSSDPKQTETLLRQIADASGNTADADAEMAGRLHLFLAHLIHMHGHRATTDTHQTYVANALRYIQYNYSGDIGVNDIARYVGISRSQLYRAFLQDFGISPHNYLQKYRINEACSLLRDPRYSIAEIAGSVGFNDPLYFSRVFKTIKHCTPTEYQKNMK
ncbi:MAG: AraC family transcriptional regulator [Clostridia bacterium]|nr:AraC family transcriptional regulator [Clostridia bacterium]